MCDFIKIDLALQGKEHLSERGLRCISFVDHDEVYDMAITIESIGGVVGYAMDPDGDWETSDFEAMGLPPPRCSIPWHDGGEMPQHPFAFVTEEVVLNWINKYAIEAYLD